MAIYNIEAPYIRETELYGSRWEHDEEEKEFEENYKEEEG